MEVIKNNGFNNHKMNESEVITRILKGEKELFEILVRRNNQKLYRIIRSHIKDDEEIADIMQNSYLKAFTKLYQFRLEASFSTWLIRIGINECLKRLKEKGKIYALSDSLGNTVDSDALEIPDNKQLNPQDKMIRNESLQLLENAIDQLDLKYRSVYIMKEVEEMSLKEIGIALKITVANVKIRLHRSKVMLKENLYELANDKNVFEFGSSKCDMLTEKIMRLI